MPMWVFVFSQCEIGLVRVQEYRGWKTEGEKKKVSITSTKMIKNELEICVGNADHS